jgi:hypothetical protein
MLVHGLLNFLLYYIYVFVAGDTSNQIFSQVAEQFQLCSQFNDFKSDWSVTSLPFNSYMKLFNHSKWLGYLCTIYFRMSCLELTVFSYHNPTLYSISL